MTIAELDRYIASRKRVIEIEERKRASYNYILADLIGRSVARIYNSANKLPTIENVYPSLFDTEEIKAKRAQIERERFTAGLQQFAQNHNKVIEGVAKDNDK